MLEEPPCFGGSTALVVKYNNCVAQLLIDPSYPTYPSLGLVYNQQHSVNVLVFALVRLTFTGCF